MLNLSQVARSCCPLPSALWAVCVARDSNHLQCFEPNSFMLWRYRLHWAFCQGCIWFKSKMNSVFSFSKKTFDSKGWKSNSLFHKIQVLPTRGTSDHEPFSLLAKWELLLLTGKRSSLWKQNHEEILCTFEPSFPFTLCLSSALFCGSMFTILLSLFITITTPPCHCHSVLSYACTLREMFFVKFWLQSQVTISFAFFSIATASGAEMFGSDL